ncbi:MAG: flagellar hook-basal body protein [Planctomycetota bacterium]
MSSYGTYLSAAGMTHAAQRVDLIANNLANLETAGFKRTLATVTERRPADVTDTTGRNRIGGGPWMGPTILDLSQGAFEPTGNKLDVALLGPGFLATSEADGSDLRLTRDGGFQISEEGYLTTNNAFPRFVLDHEGKPIDLAGVPLSKLNINKDGSITDANSYPIARIGFFEVDNPAALRPEGGNEFTGVDDVADLTLSYGTELRGGFVERANIDPTVEMTRMLLAQRQLEGNARMIQYQDTATEKLVNTVGKIS